MNEEDVRRLRKQNSKLKAKIWDQYQAFNDELRILRKQNRALKNSLENEQNRNADLFKQFSAKIKAMEEKVAKIRKTSPYIETPAAPVVEGVKPPSSTWMFVELEEEGKLLDARTDEILKKCREPIKTEYVWKSPPPPSLDNDYVQVYASIPCKKLTYESSESESSIDEEYEQPYVRTSVPVKQEKPAPARIQAVKPEAPHQHIQPISSSTDLWNVPEFRQEEPSILTQKEQPKPEATSTHKSMEPSCSDTQIEPEAPVIVVPAKEKQSPPKKEKEEKHEVYDLDDWGDDDESDNRPEIDSDVMQELNLGNPLPGSDHANESAVPSETLPINSTTVSAIAPLPQDPIDNDPEIDDFDIDFEEPQVQSPPEQPKQKSFVGFGITPQESASNMDIQFDFEEGGFEINQDDDMW